MNEELTFDGKKYISAKVASQLTGYTKDYIGQLSRSGKIDSRMVGRARFVNKKQILNYKNNLVLDGKKYVTTKQAAEITGYTSDYVGQLCRSGKVRSTIIGKERFVEEDGILSYSKNGNKTEDEVEVSKEIESTPVVKQEGKKKEEKKEITKDENFLHYIKDEAPLLPTLSKIKKRDLSEEDIPVPLEHLLELFTEERARKLISLGIALALVFGTYFFRGTPSSEKFAQTIRGVETISENVVTGIGGEFHKIISFVSDSTYALVLRVFDEGPLQLVRDASYSATSAGEAVSFYVDRAAIRVYRSISALFGREETVIVEGEPQPREPEEQPRIVYVQGPQTVTERIIEKTIERVPTIEQIPLVDVSVVTKEELEQRLSELTASVNSEIANLNSTFQYSPSGDSITGNSSNTLTTIYRTIALSNKIDNLGGVDITDSTFDGGTITSSTFDGGSITNSSVAGTSGSFSGDLIVDGNLGVGTTSPYKKLSVAGDGHFDGIITSSNLTATGTVSFTGLGNNLLVSTNSSGNLAATSTPSVSHIFATSTTATSTFAGGFTVGTSDFVVDPNAGKVGIGTTSPWAKLSIINTGTSPSFIVEDSTNPDTSPFIIDSSGNVGIGTTSPYAKLSVTGAVVGEYFHATSTTATSTFAGRLAVTEVPEGAHSFVSWITDASDSGVIDSSFVINPASAAGDANLLGVAVAGGVKFLVDAEGDVFANTLTLEGTSSLASSTIASLVVEGSSTLGDATTTDKVYFNSRIGSSLIPTVDNLIDIGEGTTPLRWRTGYFGTSIGVGTTSPFAKLSVHGLTSDTYNDTLFAIASSTASATSTHFIVTAGGNVGIGTTTPDQELNIWTNTNSANLILETQDTDAASLIEFVNDAQTWTVGTRGVSGDRFDIRDKTQGNVYPFIIEAGAPSNQLYLDSTGNVGIGASDPSQVLEIASTTVRLLFTDTSTGGPPTNDWQFTFNDNDSGSIERFVIDDITNGTSPFTIEGNTPSNTLYLDSSGNVGIGTTSPSTELHIQNSSAGAQITINSAADADSKIVFDEDATTRWQIGNKGNGSDTFRIGTPNISDANANFVIDSSGNVGIGTSTPERPLHVWQSGSTNVKIDSQTAGSAILLRAGNASADEGIFQILDSAGTFKIRTLDDNESLVGTPITIEHSGGNVGIGATPLTELDISGTAPTLTIGTDKDPGVDGDTIGNIFFNGYNSGGGNADFAKIIAIADDASSGTLDSTLRFYTRVANTETEILTVGYNGFVGVGNSIPTSALDVGTQGGGTAILSVSGSDATGSNEGGQLSLYTADDYDTTYGFYFIDAWQDDLRIGRQGESNDIRLTSAGFVGIGTNAPASTLDVEGIIRTSGASGGLLAESRDGSGTSFQWYNPTGDDIRLFGSSDLLTIDTSGHVGIGTSTPSVKLDITDDASGSQLTALRIIHNTASDQTSSMTADIDFHLWDSSTKKSSPQARIGVVGNSTATIAAESGGQLAFYTNTAADPPTLTERLRIDASGNVGIGSSTPTAKLAVEGDVIVNNGGLLSSATPSTSADDIVILGAAPGLSIISNTLDTGRLVFGGPSSETGATLRWIPDSVQLTLETNVGSGYITFETGNSVEAVRIDSAGKVGIGDTSPNQLLGLLGTAPQISIEQNDTQFLRVGTAGSLDSEIGWDDSDSLVLGLYNSPTDSTISELLRLESNGYLSFGAIGIADQVIHIANHTNPQILFDEAADEFLRVGLGETADTAVIGRYEGDDLVIGVYNSVTDTTITSQVEIQSNGDVGIGTSSPAYQLVVDNATNNRDGFLFFSGNGLTGEKDVFTIIDNDGGGGGQDESSSFKVWRTGAFNVADEGSSVVELTYTGGTADADEQFFILGRSADEGAVDWGIALSDSDFWTTGSIRGGATGTDCAGTSAACFNSPTFELGATGDSYFLGDVSIGTSSVTRELTVNSTGATWLAVRGGNSSTAGILFGDQVSDSTNRIVADNSEDSLSLWTSNTEKLTVESGGNVGVGSTSPRAKFVVAGAGNTNRGFTDLNNTGASIIVSDTSGATDNGGQILFGAESFGVYAGIKGALQSGAGPAGDLVFQTRSTSGNLIENFTIKWTGDVGVGTSSPTSDLQVEYGGSGVGLFVGDSTPFGTAAIEVDLQSANTYAWFSADAVRKFSVDANGTVYSDDLSAVGSDPLCWDGSGGSDIGDCSSLKKYKENISDLGIGLDTLLALTPREFDWIDDFGGKHDLGFVAEEVESVDPLLARYVDGELRGVKYEKFTSLIVKSIQELVASIDDRFQSVEERLTAIELKVGSSTPETTEQIITFESDLGLIAGAVSAYFESVGVKITNGVAEFKRVFAENIAGYKFTVVNKAGADSSVGEGVIVAGENSTTISNSLVNPSSKIFVSFTTSIGTASWFVSEKHDGGFTVSLSGTLANEARFDYWIIDVENEGGGTTEEAPVTSGGGSGDTEPPTITINGNNPAVIEVGTTYSDLGVLVTDNVNENIGHKTYLDGVEVQQVSLDTSETGIHIVTYTATDQAGNTASAEREIVIYDKNITGELPADTENATTTEEVIIEPTAATTEEVIVPEETTATTTEPVIEEEVQPEETATTTESVIIEEPAPVVEETVATSTEPVIEEAPVTEEATSTPPVVE